MGIANELQTRFERCAIASMGELTALNNIQNIFMCGENFFKNLVPKLNYFWSFQRATVLFKKYLADTSWLQEEVDEILLGRSRPLLFATKKVVSYFALKQYTL